MNGKIKSTFLDFNNLEKIMGEEKPSIKDFGKDVPERCVASYLLRKKGYTANQIAKAFGTSYNSVCHGVNMVRRSKKIYEIMKKIDMNFDDII